MLRLNVKDKLFVFQSFYVCNLYGLVCNLVQLLEFDEVCNFLQLMEQFTLLLVPTWRLSVLLWVAVMREMQKLQEDIAFLQNVSLNTIINMKPVG